MFRIGLAAAAVGIDSQPEPDDGVHLPRTTKLANLKRPKPVAQAKT